MYNLTIEDRTIIDTPDKIRFCGNGSAIHIRQSAVTLGNKIQSVTHYLWIWNGAQNAVLGDANQVIKKELVSRSDEYINVNIADLVNSYLVSPENAPNTNQPQFAWNTYSAPAQTGQGVFYQIISDILEEDTDGNIIATTLINPTQFATLGYRWNYEQNGASNNGLTPYKSDPFKRTVKKFYNIAINNYFNNSFVLGQSVDTCTSATMVGQTKVNPPANQTICTQDNYLIVFLNKLGLWDSLTPYGKVIISSKVDTTNSFRMFRDPLNINNSHTHSTLRDSINVKQSYSINTGRIDETATQVIEDMVYSPKVYLIRFSGDIVKEEVTGITVDNTFITVDDTNITVDNSTVGGDSIGFLSTFQQIPVIITNPEELINKTRLNNRIDIDYTIKFDETNNKILDIK